MDERNQTAVEDVTNRLSVQVFRGFHWRDCAAFHMHGSASSFSRLLLVERVVGADGGDLGSAGTVLQLRPGWAYLLPAGLGFDLHYRRGLAMYSTFLRIDDAFGDDLLGRVGGIHEIRCAPGVTRELARLAESRASVGDALRFRGLLIAAFAPLIDLSLAELGRRSRLALLYAGLLAELDRLPPARASITLLARRLGERPENLAKRFRRDVGVTLQAFMQDRLRVRMVAALGATSGTIAETAEHLGFHDPFYFSRCFKRLVGLSPRAYRAQLASPADEQLPHNR